MGTLLSILTVVVTISISVIHLLLEEMFPEVRKPVSLPPEELVSSEEEERSSKRKSDHCTVLSNALILTDLGVGSSKFQAHYLCVRLSFCRSLESETYQFTDIT